MPSSIIKRDEFEAMDAQRKVYDDMRLEAERIMSRAKLTYETKEVQGYQDGYERGRIEGAKLLISLVDGAIAYVATLEREITDIVEAAVQKLLDDQDASVLLGSMIKKNVALLEQKQRITLRVSPKTKPRIERIVRPFSAGAHALEIVDDDRIATDACVIEAGQSVVNLNLSVQISDLARIIREAL